MVLGPESVGLAEKDPRGTSYPLGRATEGGGGGGFLSFLLRAEPGKVAIESVSTPDTGWGGGSVADLGSGPPTMHHTGDKQGSEQSRRRGSLAGGILHREPKQSCCCSNNKNKQLRGTGYANP
uniref:Uncharacterized protein n=1 Tax=Mustela putorius furo TaxID=9669 RepID=M3Y397_MUSPF